MIGAYGVWEGMRRQPELTWWQRRRRRRIRKWIDEQNALTQERELRELLTGEPQPVVRAKTPVSGFTIAGIVVGALVVLVIIGILVIAATQGFQPSGG